jgi:Zn finger protein HypA/HybF involved in hydrogenase expression
MHELSVANEVCRIAEERLGTAGSRHLRVLALTVGDEAGLEPSNLHFCLEALLGQPPFGAARPLVTLLPGDELRIEYLEVEDGRAP